MTGRLVDVRSPAPMRDAVAAWLVGRTGRSVEETHDGGLLAYADDASGAHRLSRDLNDRFGDQITTAERVLEPVDWTLEWRRGLGPRRIGRLTIVPTWREPPVAEPAVVVVDPETAFGTGEHGSTRAALRLLDDAIRPGMTVLDLGSGSGLLAIAAVKLGARHAVGVDHDSEAVAVAERNARRNSVDDRVRFLEGDAAALTPLLGPVDIVVTNILRDANIALVRPIQMILNPGGFAVFAGMELTDRATFLAALSIEGFVPCAELIDEGWWAVTVKQRTEGLKD